MCRLCSDMQMFRVDKSRRLVPVIDFPAESAEAENAASGIAQSAAIPPDVDVAISTAAADRTGAEDGA